jgi:hypothetical protein
MIEDATIRNTMMCLDNPIPPSESVFFSLMPVQVPLERE